MPKTRLISPGSIPNHKLLKNLQLQDNYLSNDGGDEGISIDDAGDVSINMPTGGTAASKFEVFNQNVQYSTGTAYQASGNIVGSGTTFTSAMVGGRFIFDDGTDAGIITGFAISTVITVSTSQTVGASDDLRAYKIYYPSLQIDTSGNSSSLKIGNMTIDNDEIDLGVTGGVTIDAGDDIALSADGGNITMNDGTVEIFNFDVDTPSFTIYDDADTDGTRDFFNISVGASGGTIVKTFDDSGAKAAFLSFDIEGYIQLLGGYIILDLDTKTVSGAADNTLSISETLNLSSGAGGSDVHYGIRYVQTQTNLAGWDSVYLMHLYGGDAARTFAIQADGKVGIGEASPQDTLEVNGTVLVKDALKFTQDDGNEFIDSQNDGYLDLGATTAIRLEQDTLIEGTKKLYFNDAGSEYISGNGNDLTVSAGRDGFIDIGRDLHFDVDGYVEFDNCAVGFDKLAGAFSTSGVIGDGNDSTDIDFRLSNKYELELTDNLGGAAASEFLNLIFPATSGNFILVISQDGTGSRTIQSSSYVAYQSDGSTKATNAAFANGTDGNLRWAGGSAPTLTTTADKADIISIYWDADNQTAFAVVSQNF
jgi:hypothetical protein